jgi:hypothetical protein
MDLERFTRRTHSEEDLKTRPLPEPSGAPVHEQSPMFRLGYLEGAVEDFLFHRVTAEKLEGYLLAVLDLEERRKYFERRERAVGR